MAKGKEEFEARRQKAERGWLVEPPPLPALEYLPGEENKWYLMMGACKLLEAKKQRARLREAR